MFLYIIKDQVIPYLSKEDAKAYGVEKAPDMEITQEEFENAQGLLRVIDGKIVLGKTSDEVTSEKAAKVRATRDDILNETDKKVLIDYPSTKEEKDSVIKYRQYLRDIPSDKNFPDVEILSYEDFIAQK